MTYTQIEGIVTHDESAMKIGEYSMSVKTVLEPKIPKKEIDLKEMNESDLKLIEEQDPFLFYSIPGARSAKMRVQNVGSSTLRTIGQNKVSATHKVRRLSCVSVECHPDMLYLDEMLDVNDASMIMP